jgi:hypothetical protein
MNGSVDFNDLRIQRQIGNCAVAAALREIPFGITSPDVGFVLLREMSEDRQKIFILEASEGHFIRTISEETWFWPLIKEIIDKGLPLLPPALLEP